MALADALGLLVVASALSARAGVTVGRSALTPDFWVRGTRRAVGGGATTAHRVAGPEQEVGHGRWGKGSVRLPLLSW